jgi:O-antigen/teichoic acid export membrane protein
MLSNPKRNALASYVNTGLTAILGVVVSPILLHTLGTTNFGAWKAMQRLLDVGASAGNGGAIQSLKWVIAYRSQNATDGEKRRDLGAALKVLLLWSPVLIVMTATTVLLLPRLIRDVNDDGMLRLAGTILGLNVLLMSFVAIPDAVLFGTNQGFRSTNISTTVIALNNVGMVVAALMDLGPPGLAIVLTLGTVLNGILTFVVARRRVPWWGFGKPTRAETRRLSRFSGWIYVWNVVGRVSDATEVILFSAFAGAAVVSAFTFTSYAVLLAAQFCWLTSSALAPQLGAYVGKGDWFGAQKVARQMRELCLALATGAGSLILLLNEAFVGIWVGQEQFMGQGVNVLMVVAFIQYVMIFTDSKIQDTGLRIKGKVLLGALMTSMALIVGGFTFVLSESAVVMFGALIVVRLIGSLGFPALANRTIRNSGWPFGRALIATLILSISWLIGRNVLVDQLVELLLLGTLGTLVLAPTCFVALLSPSTRRAAISRGVSSNNEAI